MSTFLLTVLLVSTCLGSISSASAFVHQPEPTSSGHLSSNDVDYWWILNATEDDTVLLSIITSSYWDWRSEIFYPNCTLIASKTKTYTHNYQFIANETGNLLLRLRALGFSLDYTIECSHRVVVQQMNAWSEHLSSHDVDYWWIANVTEDDLVLLSVLSNSYWDWRSELFYSNLTQFDTITRTYTHIRKFIADKTDVYLLRLTALDFSLSYTIECTHPILGHDVATTDVTPEKTTVVQGEHLTIYVDVSNLGNFTETIYAVTAYYDSKAIGTKRVDDLLPGETRTLEFDWDTASVPNGTYTISAECSVVQYEVNAANNKFTDGQVTVELVPSLETEVEFSLDPNPVFVEQRVSLLGNLTVKLNGTGIAGEIVRILVNGTPGPTLLTNATGWFRASGAVGSAGIFNITVAFEGSPRYLPSSDWEILVVNKAQTFISAIFVPNPVLTGQSCMLKGILVDQFSSPIGSATVTLEYSRDGGPWKPAGFLTTDSYGIFSTTFTAPSSGIYLVRIAYAGSPSYESSTAVVALLVR